VARFTLGRRAGMLLPLSSARGPRGDLATFADAPAIARFLSSAGCSMWQLLPLNEISPGQDSPYAASSSYALEPLYIDLDQVVEHAGDDALTEEEKKLLEGHRAAARVEFSVVRAVKRAALTRAFAKFKSHADGAEADRLRDFAAFRERHKSWLVDFTLYRALHERRQTSWRTWEPPLRDRVPAALDKARSELALAMEEIAWMQWIADAQWRKARAECNALGVVIVGDLPFMCAEDSADVWSMQRYFRFDATVGVPPDAYSADGQDWGLPVPRWYEMRDAGDPWLSPRSARATELYDAFRVDHVVGLYRTYARPNAVNGVRGAPFFTPVTEREWLEQGARILTLLGSRAQVIAEDLGTVPDSVRVSLAELGLPGTKVLRWESDQGHPRDVRRFPTISLSVTGTHDSEAMATWWEALPDWERRLQLTQPELRVLNNESAHRFTAKTRDALLLLAYNSSSDALLVPITDALGWHDRMNTPGTVGLWNWTWRLPWRLGGELENAPEILAMIANLRGLAQRSGRIR